MQSNDGDPGSGSWPAFGRFAVFATVAVMPAVPSIAGGGFWLLALAGLLLHATPAGRRRAAPRDLWYMAVLVYGIDCLSVFVYDQRFREAVWYPVIALPALWPVLRLSRVRIEDLVWAACVGCFASLIWGVWVAMREADVRASLGTNAIIYGQTALASVLIVVVGRQLVGRRTASDGGWSGWRDRRHVLNLAALAGLCVVMIVGYRGALFALPVFAAAIVGVGAPSGGRVAPSWGRMSIAVAVLFIVVAVAGPREGLLDRLLLMQSEVADYASGKVGFSSLGSRMELWEAAGRMFVDHPWFGVGVHRFQDELEALRAQGLFPQDVILFKHAHNSYLTVAAEFGVLGLAVFAALLAVVVRHLREAPWFARLLGLFVLGLWLVMALTNDVLAHQATMRAIVIALAICLAVRDDGRFSGRRADPISESGGGPSALPPRAGG
ncbi:MAG: O-antigen ligase family protein [Burkholderiaceae bacterium]